MVTFLGTPAPKKNIWGRIGTAAGEGLEIGLAKAEQERKEARLQELSSRKQEQEYEQKALELAGKQQIEELTQDIVTKKLRGEDLSPEEDAFLLRQKPQAYKELNKREPKQALTEKEVPPEIFKRINKVLNENKDASADELRLKMDEARIPPVYSNPYTENRRREQEQLAKTSEKQSQVNRQETLPIRSDIAKKAMAAQQGIKNKENLIDIIERGNLDDPTLAALSEILPFNLGKRLLSPDTVEYKAGLIEEYGDLRNLFSGATRVKEIELLEEKVADLYLTDEQKKSILKSRINALKSDIIRAETAAELEGKPLGVLQFQQELDKLSKPKLDALFNQIIDEQKSIIKDAENRKQLPLDINDPDDKQILLQILQEANGDKEKARKIASKKGYKF